jgi:flagellar biosynthesis GTPase FlhF
LGNLKAHQNKFHNETVLSLAQRLKYLDAGLQNWAMLPPDEVELFKYFADLYKNSNRGIKGRGKDVKIIKLDSVTPEPQLEESAKQEKKPAKEKKTKEKKERKEEQKQPSAQNGQRPTPQPQAQQQQQQQPSIQLQQQQLPQLHHPNGGPTTMYQPQPLLGGPPHSLFHHSGESSTTAMPFQMGY